jgi:hypothetical protein
MNDNVIKDFYPVQTKVWNRKEFFSEQVVFLPWHQNKNGSDMNLNHQAA